MQETAPGPSYQRRDPGAAQPPKTKEAPESYTLKLLRGVEAPSSATN